MPAGNVEMGQEAASRFRKVRYAYVILALISVLCAVVAVEISLSAIRHNNHTFCDLMGSLTVTPAQRPANPAADKRGERTWEIYEKVLNLQNHLGC